MIVRPHIGQRLMQGSEDEIVDQATITEPDLMLGRMDVHVDSGGIHLKIEHKRRMPVIVEHVAVGLAHGMGHQAIADNATVNKEVL